MQINYWRCPYDNWSRVYVTARRLSVCPSICLSREQQQQQQTRGRRVCCWAPCGQQISIDSCGLRAAASAGSVVLRADEGGWTQTCWWNLVLDSSKQLNRIHERYRRHALTNSVLAMAGCWHCPYSMRSRVYATVGRPSARPSVCLSLPLQQLRIGWLVGVELNAPLDIV